MARALALATVGWLVVLGLAMAPPVRASAPAFSALVYLSAGRVCHQNPERSFHAGGIQWPVCARCAGLYLSAPIGAVVALRRRTGRTGLTRRQALAALSTFGTPTAITFAAEHLVGLPVTNLARFAAAWPLGAAIAWIIIVTVRSSASHRVH
jgi:uncharacterized membrane protein